MLTILFFKNANRLAVILVLRLQSESQNKHADQDLLSEFS